MVIADISGSTPLYKAVGDDHAQRLIQDEINRLRSVLLAFGGMPVGQKGDDVLSYFTDPDAALRATLDLITPPQGAALSVHVGLHHGPIVVAKQGIYGEAVNITARLATAANPGEACISETAADALAAELKPLLKPLGPLNLKGLTEPINAFSLISTRADTALRTRLPEWYGSRGENAPSGDEGLTLVISHQGRTWQRSANGQLSIGRSAECDIVLPQPWISRLHAVLAMKNGKLMLTDHSTSGTYVKSEAGREIQLKRETVMLADSGSISPSLPIDETETHLKFTIHRGALKD